MISEEFKASLNKSILHIFTLLDEGGLLDALDLRKYFEEFKKDIDPDSKI